MSSAAPSLQAALLALKCSNAETHTYSNPNPNPHLTLTLAHT